MESYDEPMVCSQCGEEATKEYTAYPELERQRDMRDGIPNPPYYVETGNYTHVDGEPLCPVVGDNGYQPGPVITEQLFRLAELDLDHPEDDPDERPDAWRPRPV